MIYQTLLSYQTLIQGHLICMFKKNPNRPPITISLRKVNSGYKVLPNDASLWPFSFKKITRAVFRNDLYNQGNKNMENGMAIGGASGMFQSLSHVTIPVSAKWFDLDLIHDIQRENFPEFFLQEDEENKLFKKTPKLYRFYRNFIINMWRQNPKKYLSPSVCRKNLPGDVSSIIRIHAFLEHWGLINFASKQHVNDYVEHKSTSYCCHVCQQTKASEYYIFRIDEDVVFQICSCCHQAEVYPTVLKEEQFIKVIPEVHDKKTKKRLRQDEVYKMLELLNSEGMREKDAWPLLSKTFPHYTREEIVQSFLEIPSNYQMNANIFDNNEDFMIEGEPPTDEEPTIFQDYENQEQISIALAYYLYKTCPQKYPELDNLFNSATKHSNYLSEEQNQKCIKMIRMLIDVQQSKLELKTMFIQQLQKLTFAEMESYKSICSNTIAQQLKNFDFEDDV